MQYFLTYNLGLYREGNLKAQLGTATHKVLEWIAHGKKYHQDNPNETKIKCDDDLDFADVSDFYSKYSLSDEDIIVINKQRKAKSVYDETARIKGPVTRIGREYTEYLISEAIKRYSEKSTIEWANADKKRVNNFVWITLEKMNNSYDPRTKIVICPEKKFDIPIEADWAKTEYGNFRIKGTIDLITHIRDGYVEITDYKTGERKDWNTGEYKSNSMISNDTQLMLYNYAIMKEMPEVKGVIVTIFYIRAGGPVSVTFEKSDLNILELKLKEFFEKVKELQVPKMCHPRQLDMKCQKLCPFYKEKWPGVESNVCKFIHSEIRRLGIDKVSKIYSQIGHDISNYTSPGE
jgi:ATP-dependent helicase/DNAse subunit B